MLDSLEVLDLEGNLIDDLSQVEFLTLCSSLKSLNLEGNPVCVVPHPSSTAEVSIACEYIHVACSAPRNYYPGPRGSIYYLFNSFDFVGKIKRE